MFVLLCFFSVSEVLKLNSPRYLPSARFFFYNGSGRNLEYLLCGFLLFAAGLLMQYLPI